MKKNLLFSIFPLLLFSCKQSPSPKETAQTFIKSMASSDITTASSLASEETKPLVDKAKTDGKPVTKPEESFQLNTLAETINGEKAEVKNDLLSMTVVKEDEGWKVVVDETLLNAIQHREEMLAQAEAKWAALQKEYEGRMTVAKTYVDYKKHQGPLSPQVKALGTMLDSMSHKGEWTKEILLAYVQKQKQLNKAIEAALEPSSAANADLSLNYFLQISTAGDRIKAAEADYQSIAEKAHSPVFVPLPTSDK